MSKCLLSQPSNIGKLQQLVSTFYCLINKLLKATLMCFSGIGSGVTLQYATGSLNLITLYALSK